MSEEISFPSEPPLAPISDAPPPPSRAPGGRFAQGNREGKGNPHAKHVNRLRSALMRAVTPEDMKAIVATLIEQAKAGDVASAKEVLDRCLGRSTPPTDEPEGSLQFKAFIGVDMSKI